jgi:Domain of unknown function (DUF4190)
MSQMPPGGPPNYPPNYPPYVPPGMQGPSGYSLPPTTRTSGAAITSLVCGLIMCIPFVTGLVAVITGFIGISTTSNPAVKGRGMAIAGLILGLLSLAGWGLLSIGSVALFHGSTAQRVFAKQYLADLSGGNIDQCVQHSSSRLTRDQIAGFSKQAQGWGTMNDTTVMAFSLDNNNGTFKGAVSGACKFNSGTHTFVMALIKESGVLKVDAFQWQQ